MKGYLENIILFDGHCNMCSGIVKWIIRYDQKKIIRFAPLQSKFAHRILASFKIEIDIHNTFIFIQNGAYYTKSTAALKLIKQLSYWRILHPLVYLPLSFRDLIYSTIAKHRYYIFGKRTDCMVPDKDIRERFLG